jgi:hypothetical protein
MVRPKLAKEQIKEYLNKTPNQMQQSIVKFIA